MAGGRPEILAGFCEDCDGDCGGKVKDDKDDGGIEVEKDLIIVGVKTDPTPVKLRSESKFDCPLPVNF